MIKVLVVSDDMTGNNDVGALLNQSGLNTVAALSDHISKEYMVDRDALCLNTDSRALTSEQAREKVKQVVNNYWNTEILYCKRIDSTLRGNVGSEIDGILGALPKGYKAVVVPAFPKAGRICIGGYMLVDGRTLEECGAHKDVKTPVYHLKVKDIIASQSTRLIETVELKQVRSSQNKLVQTIIQSQADIMIADAVNEHDIIRIARACHMSGVQIVCVDPGSFTAAMAREKYVKNKSGDKNLLVIGSLAETTRRQVDYLIECRNPLVCLIEINRLLQDFDVLKKEVLTWILSQVDEYEDILLLTDDVTDGCEDKILKAEKISEYFTALAAEIYSRLQNKIACVYLCGGDTAQDFLETLDVQAIDIKEEVLPLAVYGRTLCSGKKSFQVLTKGGMIGERNAIIQLLEYAKCVRQEEGE